MEFNSIDSYNKKIKRILITEEEIQAEVKRAEK